MELPYHPVIFTSGNKNINTLMFIAALFTIAKIWKQPKCPPVDEWIQNCGTFTQWNNSQL